jgi:hypothetical protein
MVLTQRFVEIAPPLDQRVGGTMAMRFREAVSLGLNVQDRINTTVHNEALRERAANTAIDAIRPGTITFGLLVVAILAYCVQRWIVHLETMRIVREHGAPCQEQPAPRTQKTHNPKNDADRDNKAQ